MGSFSNVDGKYKILTSTRIETPYGQRLSWKIPDSNGITFTIHLKDSTKVIYYVTIHLISVTHMLC